MTARFTMRVEHGKALGLLTRELPHEGSGYPSLIRSLSKRIAELTSSDATHAEGVELNERKLGIEELLHWLERWASPDRWRQLQARQNLERQYEADPEEFIRKLELLLEVLESSVAEPLKFSGQEQEERFLILQEVYSRRLLVIQAGTELSHLLGRLHRAQEIQREVAREPPPP